MTDHQSITMKAENQRLDNEEVALRLWDGDETVKADLLMGCGPSIQAAIQKKFPRLTAEDVEDVFCEAVQRFWMWRNKFDPAKSSVGSRLYWFAEKVACEHAAGRLKRHSPRQKERAVAPEFFSRIEDMREEPEPVALDDVGDKPSAVQRAVRDCFQKLPPLQQDILVRYIEAGEYTLDAAAVGEELGQKHKGGVAIPGGNIRTYHSRAKATLKACMKTKQFDLVALGYTDA